MLFVESLSYNMMTSAGDSKTAFISVENNSHLNTDGQHSGSSPFLSAGPRSTPGWGGSHASKSQTAQDNYQDWGPSTTNDDKFKSDD